MLRKAKRAVKGTVSGRRADEAAGLQEVSFGLAEHQGPLTPHRRFRLRKPPRCLINTVSSPSSTLGIRRLSVNIAGVLVNAEPSATRDSLSAMESRGLLPDTINPPAKPHSRQPSESTTISWAQLHALKSLNELKGCLFIMGLHSMTFQHASIERLLVHTEVRVHFCFAVTPLTRANQVM